MFNILLFYEVMTSRVCPAALLNYAIKRTTHSSLTVVYEAAFCNYMSQILIVPTGAAAIRKYSESRPQIIVLAELIAVDLHIILKTEKFTTNVSSKL